MENIIYEVSLHTDYNTTIKLLQLYTKILNQYNNIWKLKCEKQYPNKPYFDLWTGAENYLMCTKRKFMVIINNIDYYDENSPYFYEYDKMLKDVYNRRLCVCHEGDIIVKSLSLFNKDCKFIIMTSSNEYQPNIVNYFNSHNECINWIKSCNNPNYWNTCNIYIIDINKLIPIFFGKKPRKHDISISDNVISYYKYIDNVLITLIPESYCLNF